MSFIGEAALSVFLELLMGKLVSSSLNFVADYRQVHEQLKEWKSKLPCLQAVLNDAEERQIKDDGVKNWLAGVQDLAYDVDDILDEFAYEALRLKLQKPQADQASISKVRKLMIPTCCLSYFSTPASVEFNINMIPKIKEITARLNNLASQKDVLELREISGAVIRSKQGMKARLQPTSLVDEGHVYGRENEKREILELLIKNSNVVSDDEVPVVSILGMGGMGKTTLAQLVYNDDSLRDSFDLKAWVCVSDDFDAINITKTILQSIGGGTCDYNDLNLLQVKLKEKLSGKKFLLVLDDIWNESYDDWTILRSPFGVGTKIIVTTRLQNVSSNVVTVKAFHLDKLSHDDSLSIFARHALGARDFSWHSELKDVGEKIVRRCAGLPLAAKAMGGLLRTIRDQSAWEEIYESEIWELPEERCGILPALRLSYHHLPSHLKRCFAYCSIFPKDYEFEVEEMILLWRAEGFLQQKDKSQIKDFGNQCFRDLVSRSFLQISSKDNSRYVMHDLMNDLAQLVAGEICSKLEGGKQQKISCRTRHSSYVGSRFDGVKKFEAFDQVKYLRTFLPLDLMEKYNPLVCCLSSFVLDNLLSRLNCLRVLSLKGYCITKLPDGFFENLKHLRFLDFSGTSIKCLPDSLCTVYHLQTLKLRKCWKLEKLPSEIGELNELHYLDIRDCYSLKGMPLGVGKLSNLQMLSDFLVGEGDGHHIRGLKIFSNLRGDFRLSGLQNVKGQDAREAKLNEKSGIGRLTLQWSRDFENDTIKSKEEEVRVLEFLRPPKKLEHLIIENYGGAKFSAWIVDSSFKNLLSLKLWNCRDCKSLPSFGRLPLLKDLLISGFNAVKDVGVELFGENQPNAFASLETLRFEDMPNWKEWDSCEGDDQVSKFPCLREFSIRNCPELLGRLPSRLHSLQKLEIYECRRLLISISSFPSLRELTINGCEELVDGSSAEVIALQKVRFTNISKFSIPRERIMSMFTNLERFEIGGWKELASLSEYGFGLIGHRYIIIQNCPQLVSLETEEEGQLQLEKISGIEWLAIWSCEKLNRLPRVLHALPFLTRMSITGCPSLVCFAENNLPPTLKSLHIQNCKNFKYLMDERGSTVISNSCFLEDLIIENCESLIFLSSRADGLNGVRFLKVECCSKLTSLFLNPKLPKALTDLRIWECPEVESIAQDFYETTALQSIMLRGCYKIKSLPQGLDKLSHLLELEIDGCSNLVSFKESGPPTAISLRELWVTQCPVDIHFPEEDFPTNLTTLQISNAPKIYRSLVERGLDRLISLKKLYIGGKGCSDVVSFPKEDMMLPASLTFISISNFENLECLFSNAFQNLTSFEHLSIYNCSKLRALPGKDMLLSLGELEIRGCPLLEENYKRDQGREWSKIAHIPLVTIDHEWIIPPEN